MRLSGWQLAFLNAKSGERVYFPQKNGMVFSFGRDVNINWKHGVNALPEEEQTAKGRISIVLWGLAQDVKEEDGSPPMVVNRFPGGGRGRGGGRGGSARTSDEVCRDFKAGKCRFGRDCRWKHSK